MRILVLIFVGVLSVNCNYLTKKYYTNPEENFSKLKSKTPYDAIIIPGFPHYKDSTTMVIKARVNWAVYLYNSGFAKNIIFSGAAVYTPYIEAKIMSLYAEKMGIPSEHIFIENQAEHSIENIYYSCLLGKNKGFKTFALASDVVQSSFLKSINQHRYEMEIDFLPIVMDSLLPVSKNLPNINQQDAFVVNFISLPDRKKLFTRLKGTKGKKVGKLLKAEKKLSKTK